MTASTPDSPAPAAPVANRMLSMGAVIATATLFGLTYSLSAPLIAIDLSEAGFGETMIGLNAAMHAVGVLIVAPLLPRIVARTGPRRLVITALVVAAAMLALFPAMPSVWLWFPLRLILGGATEVLFVLSETWINTLADERSRARSMAIYTASMSLGFALGPLILTVTGSAGALPFLIGAVLTLAAVPLIASRKVTAPHFEEPTVSNPLRFIRLAPVAIGTTVLNAALETAGMSLLPLYAMTHGWVEAEATTLLSALMFGAIVLQLPIGWLGDKVDRMKLVLSLAVLAGLGSLLWPFVLHTAWLANTVLFLWGGLFVGIYTIMLTVVGSRFKGSDLVGIYAVMGLVWGAGALVGPTLAGLAMDLVPHGLPLFAAAACGLFVVYMLRVGRDT